MSGSQARNSTKTLAIRGVLFNWIGRGCSFVITFFLTPYLIHTLGDEQYGLWSIVMSLTSYYGLADMGLRGAGTKYIAQYHALNDRESINKVIVTSLVVYSGLAALVAFASGIMAWAFPYIFQVAAVSEETIRIIVLLTGATIVLRMLSQVFNATLVALHRHDIANVAAVSQQLSQAAAVVAVLFYGGGLPGMAWATLGIAALGQLTRSIVARRLLPGISLSWRYFDRATLKLVFRFGAMTSATRVARRMTERLGAIVIGVFLGPAAVAYYDVAERLALKSSQVGRALQGVLDPLASRLDATGDRAALLKVMTLGSRLMAAAGLYMVVIFVVGGHQFIAAWIGPSYADRSYPVLCLLSVAVLARLASGPLRSVLRGSAHLGTLLRVSSLEVLLIIVLAPTLVWRFGIVGMAAAVLVARSMSGFVLLPFATCNALGYSWLRYLRDAWVPASVVAAASLATILPIQRFLEPSRLLHVLAEFAAVAIVAVVATFLACLDKGQRRDIVHALSIRRWKEEEPPAVHEQQVPLAHDSPI